MRARRHILVAVVLSLALIITLAPNTSQYQQLRQQWSSAKEEGWDETKWGFQLDIPWFDLPDFNSDLIDLAPHHFHPGRQATFATFYASRNATNYDPYFLAAQQILYRLLWDPKSKSEHHPVTIFVAPFIVQEQRDYFTAAGAIVHELPLRRFVPDLPGAAGRLRDMFSKLEMWNQTKFSKIAYLDSDAFPLVNIDAIFNIAEEQECRKELLSVEDQNNEICNYTLAGYKDQWLEGVNAGVLVFSPEENMYNRLIRLSLNHSSFDNGFMEQALLDLAYHSGGPFPPSFFEHAYNGGVDTIDRGEELYVAHHKLWATAFDPPDAWYKNVFNDTWLEMLDFYKSKEFRAARLADGLKSAWV